MKTDKLFYRLFHTQPELALELAGIQAPYPKGYRHRSLELKETSFRLDGVLQPPSAVWLHVFWEAQSREEIRTMLHLPDTDLTETRFYREAFAEGEARGEAKGEARGEERGKRKGELALILRLLHRRLGAVSTGYEDRVRALSLDHLEILGEDLLDFRTEGDLADWLGRHAV